MKRIFTVMLFCCGATMGTQVLADRAPEEIYSRTCGVCHQAGVANAPKTGDAAAWKARLDAKGAEALLASVKNGLNAMPPKGMCMDCTDGEYQALIDHMAKGE